ncbi:hypothetical protein LTR53_010151 [Teratosphaeriaceae sp. CCFEE 6253]|nr:hypothetical protein LTR53_010151 [Teratosphaeriaceae sp. CCFEE 6253]
MATLLWQRRDLASDAANVRNTFTSWDSCMTKAYCKWPAIVGIIIGSLIVLSLLWCLFRCLCCGAECCCGCLACCNTCCPSPRGGKRNRNDGYHQQPPPPQPGYQPYPQYQLQPPPLYAAAGGYRGAQTATFDAPSPKSAAAKYNEDALPAMPSWDNAASRRVDDEDVELEKMDHPQAHQQSLLQHQQPQYHDPYQQQQQAAGDIGTMHADPYHNHAAHRQYAPSPVASARESAYPPTYPTSPTTTMYEPPPPSIYETQGQQYGGGYAQSVAPSYHTNAPTQQGAGFARKPVQGSWRDV